MIILISNIIIIIIIFFFFGWSYLINGTRNETVDVFIGSKDLWESGAESWGSLDSGKSHLSDVVTITEAKDTLGLIHGDTLLDL